MPSGAGLGGLEGYQTHQTILLLPLPHPFLTPQLKVPVEEPAGELPVNEIEAWKAAEKVGVSCPLELSQRLWR